MPGVHRFNQSSRASRHSSSRAVQENEDEYEEEDDVQEEPMEAEDGAESRKPRKTAVLLLLRWTLY